MYAKGAKVWTEAKVLQAHEGAPRPYQIGVGDPHGNDSDQCVRLWVSESFLRPNMASTPVTVRCDKCGFERPLRDFETAEARAEALGISFLALFGPEELVRICAALAEKGYTVEEFVEGLTNATKEKE